MHHALIPSVIFSAVLLLAKPSGSTGDPGPQPTNSLSDDGLILQNPVQAYSPTEDIEEDKRGWRDLQPGWGKRSWKDLHSGGWGKRGWRDLHGGGWGKRAWSDLQPTWGKRGWQDLQGSWGKRDWNKFHGSWGKRDHPQYGDDSYEDEEPESYYEDEDEDLEDVLQEVKRAWNNLKGNWGKRDWSNFKGSWGKRDPAWHNLKGLWGKRSAENKWNKLQAVWGKRSLGGVGDLEGCLMASAYPVNPLDEPLAGLINNQRTLPDGRKERNRCASNGFPNSPKWAATVGSRCFISNRDRCCVSSLSKDDASDPPSRLRGSHP